MNPLSAEPSQSRGEAVDWLICSAMEVAQPAR